MSDEAKVILGLFLGWPALLIVAVKLLEPSPMQLCMKAGYEWRGGDCVMGVDHD
jgi:hypothetical protein